MIEFLPVLSVLMLAVSSVLLDIAFARTEPALADFSHLTDPNCHLEDLVTYTALNPRRLAKA